MKTKGILLAFALFTMALCASVLGEFSRRVDRLHASLETSEDRLGRARGEMDRIREESEHERLRIVDGLAETRRAFDSLQTRLTTRDSRALYSDILAPSVQINARGGVGGGTLLYSRPGHSYVITAFHVIQKAVLRGEKGGRRSPVEVRVYDGSGRMLDTVDGSLAAYDERKDLSLLHLETDRVFPRVARLASREFLRSVRIFDPIYAVGCPLGHDPLPTLGEIATLRKDVSGENFWMMNAPTIYGNSGGGIFHRRTRELIGVSAMVCTYDGVVSTPVPHLGILVSLETVYDWLDRIHYGFVYDPTTTMEACERARRRAVVSPPPVPASIGGM